MPQPEADVARRTSSGCDGADPVLHDIMLDQALHAVVDAGWTSTLGTPPVAAQTWEEAGGDSLMTLHLMLALERALGRPVSFDMVNGGMNADDIVRALQSEMRTRGDERPVLYLLPGVFGDELGLADFRRAVAARVRCELVSMPDLETPAAVLGNMCASGRVVADDIMRRAPTGNVMIAGYSFGGSLAMEAARHLTAAGRTVTRLIVLDTMFRDANDASVSVASRVRAWRLTPLWRRRRGLFVRLAASDRLRPTLLRIVRWLAPRSEHVGRHLLHRHFRVRAIGSWRPAALAVPVLLVASEHSTPDMIARWRTLCPGLDIVRLHGGHNEMFQPEALGALSTAVIGAVEHSIVRPHSD